MGAVFSTGPSSHHITLNSTNYQQSVANFSADILEYNNNSTHGGTSDFRKLEDMYEIYRPTGLFIHRVVIPFWWAIGFPGNCLAFTIWIQRRMRQSSGCYLAALAMTDLVFLVLHVLFELEYTWRLHTIEYPIICEVFPIVYLTCQYLSLLLVLAFTVERYISICHPYLRAKYGSTSLALRVIIGLIVTSLVLTVIQPYFWQYNYERETCEQRASSIPVWTVWSWTTELLLFGVVPLAILVLNFLVIVVTRKISSRDRLDHAPIVRQQSNRSRNRSGGGSSSATTFMLLVVSFYLIAATLPVTVIYVLHPRFPAGNETMTDEQIQTDPTWQTHFKFSNLRMVIQDFGMSHFALNFYIYFFTGKIFRKELARLCSTCPCAYVQKAMR